MKFTVKWLKEHLETDASLDELSTRLTMLGLEVEDIRDAAVTLRGFQTARVVSAEQHPDADRLRVCVVDTGNGEALQVVCGAPNARAGMIGVFAPSGAHIPGTGIDLKKTTIRGVESDGMLLSEREMGISEDHDGIVDLPAETPIGLEAAQVMGLDDPVIELGITPDRADCFGVYGIARDLAAANVGTLKPLVADKVVGSFEPPVKWKRDFAAGHQNACPMVVGRYFRGVSNGPSPKWLQDRLIAIGLRPISALVDITNFVTFDLCRPLHVFDADKLAGDLTMRFAHDDEKIFALDGREYTLKDGMTVIADINAVHGIAGIMGGEETGCTEETTNVFLEVALFDPIRTATTGRKLGIESDARYRFERGLDPISAYWGTEVATRLILEFCGGEASELTIAGEMPDWVRPVSLKPERLKTFGGVDISEKEAVSILKRLGFEPKIEAGIIKATTPSWRADVSTEYCLIEEILRVKGFDKIPAVPMERESSLPAPAIGVQQRRAAYAKRTLAQRGMMESVTWSFMPGTDVDLFGGVTDEMRLANPISADLDVMRPTILPNLIAAAKRNADRGYPDCGLFEVGPAYRNDTPTGQDSVAAGLRHGSTGPRHWLVTPSATSVFDAKADSYAVLAAIGVPVDKLLIEAQAPAWYHPGRSGTLRLGKTILANFGEIHPRILRRIGDRGPAAGFEVFLDRVPKPRQKSGRARPSFSTAAFQPVNRDFAFVVEKTISADQILRSAKSADRKLISDAGVFDVYEGESLGADRKSVAVWLTLQPTERTLTDEEIDAVAAKVIDNVKKQTGGKLRG
ncbi:MAG: Phenylalanine--tRNA ligase beta subunit [Alphaproteobacteria bacterium MarineAlpha4_Bin2]|nr:MAG: Phenylalanine--tRNA ligase beta subunit [Alphaproteobacteria bacterium MarineAlpha4_Bin2]